VAWTGSQGEYQEFIDRHGLTFPQISDDQADVFGRFGIPAQPAIAIVSPDGEVETLFGAADEALLDSLIERALS
jgi:peroxiredoxin